MTRLALTPALLVLALGSACIGDTVVKLAAPTTTQSANTEVPGASTGQVTGTIVETQQGALLHVNIQREDGEKMTLVCDRQCFPNMKLLEEGRRVRLQWQRQRVKAGDEVFYVDVITKLETP